MRKAETLKWEGLLTADCRKAGGEDNAEGGFGVAKVGWPVQCRTLMKNKPPVTMDEKVVQYYCLAGIYTLISSLSYLGLDFLGSHSYPT